jgi:hypothetical protein
MQLYFVSGHIEKADHPIPNTRLGQYIVSKRHGFPREPTFNN